MKQSALSILQQKFGKKTQTGGKGSFRRKMKRSSHLQKNIRDPIELDYRKLIDSLNFKIQCLSEEDTLLWNLFIDNELFYFLMELSKKDMNRKYQKQTKLYKLSILKEFYDDCIQLQLVNEINGAYFFQQNYKFIKKLLSERGFEYWKDTLQLFQKNIEKGDYRNTNEENEDNKETISPNELLTLFGLSTNEIPSKEQLKKAYYKKSLEYHPDKHPNEIKKYTDLFKKMKQSYQQLVNYYKLT